MFDKNILYFFHILKVNHFFNIPVIFCQFRTFYQNMCLKYHYVNLIIHMLSLWIMWITLCIT